MILSFMLASLLNVFVVESPSYAKEMVAAAHEITARYPEVRIIVRTTEQVLGMSPNELKQSMEQASVVILGRIYGDVAERIQQVFGSITPPQVVFTAHSDFAIYELSRFGSDRPFRNIPHEQIEKISAGTLNAKDIPQLRRWGRSFEYVVAKGPENFRNLILDLLSNIDARYRPEPVRTPPAVFIYKAGSIYADADSFAAQVQPNRPTVAIIDHDSYYHSGDIDIEDNLDRK